MTLHTKKKLLVLDVNGLLVERFFQADKRPEHRDPDGKVGKFYVYKRPFCQEFLTFCFEKFEVGIWSSAQQHNVQKLVDFVFGDLKSKLLFTWHQTDCTDTGLRTLENNMKPVFLKELYKLWRKLKPDLPWEEGDYGPFNTLLIDDTPYKAIRNPPHTAIFPYPYEVSNDSDDALVGALRRYLEGIAGATNVQNYVKYHPFGQLPISEESADWHFYRDILEDDGLVETAVTCMTERNGTIATTLSQKHTILNGLEENGVAKATQPMNRKRKSAMQAVLNEEHEAHNSSLVDKETSFGISQQSDLDGVSKDDVLFETAVTCTTKKNGAAVTTLSQKHVNLNGLEEDDVDKVTNPRKKRRNIVIEAASNQEHEARNSSMVDNHGKKRRNSDMKAALNQEHESHNSSVVDNPRKKRRNSVMEDNSSDLDMISKDGGWYETTVTCTTERNGLSGNKEVDTQTNKYHVGNNTLKRAGREDVGFSNRGHHYKDNHFNRDYGNCSSHRPSVSYHTNTGSSRTYHTPTRLEGNWRDQNGVNATLHSQVAQAGTYSQTNTGGSRTSQFPRKSEGNWLQHQTDSSSTIQTRAAQARSYAQTNAGSRTHHFSSKFERDRKHQNDVKATLRTQVTQAGTSAQTNYGGSRTSHCSRQFERDWRHPNDANIALQRQVAQAGTYAQTNYGGSGTSHIPIMYERDWSHQNGVNVALQTHVVQAGTYANNNAFGRSFVPENLVVYQGGGHTNGGHYQSWVNPPPHLWGGSHGAHHQNHNHFYNPQLSSHFYSKPHRMRQKSNDRKTHCSNNRY